jgi:quercetin dioxygenase-like cupin family protein
MDHNPDGTHVSIVGSGVLPHGFRLHAAGETGFVFQEVTLDPGASTGWHSHPGPLLVVVRSGLLTHEARGRTVREFGPGEAFIELPGAGNEHCGRNLGDEPVKLEVLFIAPGATGRPLDVLACSA